MINKIIFTNIKEGLKTSIFRGHMNKKFLLTSIFTLAVATIAFALPGPRAEQLKNELLTNGDKGVVIEFEKILSNSTYAEVNRTLISTGALSAEETKLLDFAAEGAAAQLGKCDDRVLLDGHDAKGNPRFVTAAKLNSDGTVSAATTKGWQITHYSGETK